ncbi:MAG TPA: twin-arginine translocation signal domain-containing protein, partial [Chloroflexota bacterium]|nr:twin-arginine translocation signal domain-containing protein [Chloroflexota bacterium]
MTMSVSRRRFLVGVGAAGAMAGLARAAHASCPFRVAVINDEITQDFDHACYVAAHDFGLEWIELRAMWNKNVTDLNAAEIGESKKILAKHKLRVTDIASPLYKTAWAGAPPSKQSDHKDQFHADFDFKQQDE